MSEVDYETHPSWGMIGVNKVNGGSGKNFFGSDIQTNHFIEITIRQAEKGRKFNKDFYCGDTKITTVLLTPLQFAEMITLMNTGDGVPCTIDFTQKQGYIQFKSEQSKLELIIQERENSINEAFNKLLMSIIFCFVFIEFSKFVNSVSVFVLNVSKLVI